MSSTAARRRTVLVLGCLGALGLAISCAQIEGLDHYQDVECTGDCDGGALPPRPSSLPPPPPPPPPCGDCGGDAGADTGSVVDGVLTATGALTLNVVRTGNANGTTGSPDIAVAASTGFAQGDLVLVHQTRGAGAGTYEQATIAAVADEKLTFTAPLAHTYTMGGVDAAQVVRFERFTSVDVTAGAVLDAPAWDGVTGGILPIKTTGAVTVEGAIDLSGKGFRGPGHADACNNGHAYRCVAGQLPTGRGDDGESGSGPSKNDPSGNGAGGGGGFPGHCNGGAGGGYGTAGTAPVPIEGTGPPACGFVFIPIPPGTVAGDVDLTGVLLFGGAGGEGGGDDQGAYPGPGGNGGGIVVIDASSLTVTGKISADGKSGGGSVATAAGCGGAACGMGPGGGGAGGAILVSTSNGATIGTDLVTAVGGAGGACDCAGGPGGGNGGDGRTLLVGSVTGSAKPAQPAPSPAPH